MTKTHIGILATLLLDVSVGLRRMTCLELTTNTNWTLTKPSGRSEPSTITHAPRRSSSCSTSPSQISIGHWRQLASREERWKREPSQVQLEDILWPERQQAAEVAAFQCHRAGKTGHFAEGAGRLVPLEDHRKIAGVRAVHKESRVNHEDHL